ncbi:hypothetical protein [Novipirellula artificiosorum]|uniref:Uncharacterized protein n=1 Tax=Novipirellula artificiosorum TaxID=2528016 RepID=A0A5C6E316_9BACT|nr:hypothetical protein [Novipirellula artificiosorum]TWU42011.1 hypothetical protein Poly41_03070 [Novipirellula artificiosorum]
MQFIEITGKTLLDVVNDGEIDLKELHDSGVNGDSILRINKFGEIELRGRHGWTLVGGLIGNFEDRLVLLTGLDWAE